MKESKAIVMQKNEEAAKQQETPATAFVLGRDLAGNDVICDLAKMPHLLIAGVRFAEVSGLLEKMIEALHAQGVKVSVPEPDEAFDALESAKAEMESRIERMEAAKARTLAQYKPAQGEAPMDRQVVAIWELDALMRRDAERTEELISAIAQRGRRAGIHLVAATRRPHADVLCGVIRANIPSRLALCVRSEEESRLILDRKGAEELRNEGDMLYLPMSCAAEKPISVHGEGIGSETEERLVQEAMNLLLDKGEISFSALQQKLLIGFLHTGRIADELVRCGLIAKISGASAIYAPLISAEQWYDWQDIPREARI